MTHPRTPDRTCCDGLCEQGRTCPRRAVQDFEGGVLRRVHDPEPDMPGTLVFLAAVVSLTVGGFLTLWFL